MSNQIMPETLLRWLAYATLVLWGLLTAFFYTASEQRIVVFVILYAGLLLLTTWTLVKTNLDGNSPLTRIFVSVIAVCSIVLGTFICERILNHFQDDLISPFHRGIIYRPNSILEVDGGEFQATYFINNLGIRGPDADLSDKDTCQILILGDSFAYGWGLNWEVSWPSILQTSMSESGHDVEIFNVSRPGIGPRSYAHIAEVSIPLLDPNVVLVNILQGDDVMQAQAASIDVPQPLAITTNSQDNWISRTFSKYYPNVMGLFVNSASFSSVEEYQRTQRQVFQSIVDNYPEYPYENIDPEAYALFESGLLNPGILGTAIGQPDYFIIPTQLDTPETQTLLAALTESLSIIANQTSPEQVLVIAVPYRAFINAQDQQYLRSMGLSVNPDLLETSAMDDGIQMATEKADPSMLFLSVTDNFRASNEALYFQWDGHFNAAGSALFAHSIQPRVEEMCQSQGPS